MFPNYCSVHCFMKFLVVTIAATYSFLCYVAMVTLFIQCADFCKAIQTFQKHILKLYNMSLCGYVIYYFEIYLIYVICLIFGFSLLRQIRYRITNRRNRIMNFFKRPDSYSFFFIIHFLSLCIFLKKKFANQIDMQYHFILLITSIEESKFYLFPFRVLSSSILKLN